jgi:predicted nucleic acid-binding protein
VTKRFVLDAWAILALLQKEEPAASRVKELLENAGNGGTRLFLSIINLGEVYYRVGKLRGGREAAETLVGMRRLPLRIVSATDELVLDAARLKMEHPISYADAFAAATSADLGATLATGDPELTRLSERPGGRSDFVFRIADLTVDAAAWTKLD